MPESWQPIAGFAGYEVSDLGNVRTFRPKNGRGPLKEESRPVRQDKAKGKEYFRVFLGNGDGTQISRPVHQLVLEAFSGPRPSPEHDACHRDGVHTNNVSTNLYWGTKQENADDRIRHGTQVKGEQVGLAVLTDVQVSEIKAALPTWKRGMGRYFANKFGVGDSAISAIKNGDTWRHL